MTYLQLLKPFVSLHFDYIRYKLIKNDTVLFDSR